MKLLVCSTVAALAASLFASHALARHDESVRHEVKKSLRTGIADQRQRTWYWQDKAGVKRWPTRFHERRASLPYLYRLAKLWKHRHVEARKHYHAGPVIDSCLRTLIGREGGMNPHAYNASSGAYGAPQALPGEKMASAGADWRDNLMTQIKWMIGYVNSRWGGSCAALAHSYAYGWY